MTDSTQIRGESLGPQKLAGAVPPEGAARLNDGNTQVMFHGKCFGVEWRRGTALVHRFAQAADRRDGRRPVTRAEIDESLDAVTGARALAYRKLVDATAGTFALSAIDLRAIGAKVRSLHAGPVGAVVLVLTGRLPPAE